jgi:hypothetical protein
VLGDGYSAGGTLTNGDIVVSSSSLASALG